jgi:hypothetical protein
MWRRVCGQMIPDVYCNRLHIFEYDGQTILRNVGSAATNLCENLKCRSLYATAVKYNGFARPASWRHDQTLRDSTERPTLINSEKLNSAVAIWWKVDWLQRSEAETGG